MKRIILILVAATGVTLFLNSCSKEYSIEKAEPVGNAVFSLHDSIGNCLPDSVHGTFYNGVTPGPDTAFVALQVNVDSVGSYKIYTDLQNGFMFADSGFFNTTGLTTVLLRPIGTPILQTVTTFSLLSDASVCNFTIYVKDSTGTGLGGNTGGGTDSTNFSDTAWQFSVDTSTFNGSIDSALVGSDTSGNYYLALFGSTAATGDSLFSAFLLLPNDVIEPGTYNTNTGSALIFSVPGDTTAIYQAHTLTPDANTAITITNYDSINNIVEGTFSGTAYDAEGNVITITNGRFRVKVR